MDQTELLHLLGWDEALIGLASCPETDADVLAALATSENHDVRAAVAGNPACPEAVLTQLAWDVADGVRVQVGANPHTPGESLLALAHSGNVPAIRSVAANPYTPPTALGVIVAGGDDVARETAARAPLLHDGDRAFLVEAVRGLRHSPGAEAVISNPRHRLTVGDLEQWPLQAARNPNCPPVMLADLAAHPGAEVRAAVAAHPACPPAAMQTLAGDERRDVRANIAGNAEAPPDLVAAAADDDDWAVRAAAAAHPAVPWLALELLLADSDETVRYLAAAHPGVDEALIAELAEDPDPALAHGLVRNPRCPDDVRAAVALGAEDTYARCDAARQLRDPDALRALIGAAGGDQVGFLRGAAAANPQIAAAVTVEALHAMEAVPQPDAGVSLAV